MTKDDALKVADGSVAELARMLKIKSSAVSQWNDKKIPELRKYQIEEIMQKQQQPEPEEA